MTAIDDAAMEGHGDDGETGGGDNGLSDPTDVGTSAAASAPMPPPSAAAAAAPVGRRRRAHTAKKGAHFTPDPLAAVPRTPTRGPPGARLNPHQRIVFRLRRQLGQLRAGHGLAPAQRGCPPMMVPPRDAFGASQAT